MKFCERSKMRKKKKLSESRNNKMKYYIKARRSRKNLRPSKRKLSESRKRKKM